MCCDDCCRDQCRVFCCCYITPFKNAAKDSLPCPDNTNKFILFCGKYRYIWFPFQFEIKIPFVSCSLFSNKKIRKYSQKSLDTLRGVAGPHPFFWQKLKLGILTKLFYHRVAYNQYTFSDGLSKFKSSNVKWWIQQHLVVPFMGKG